MNDSYERLDEIAYAWRGVQRFCSADDMMKTERKSKALHDLPKNETSSRNLISSSFANSLIIVKPALRSCYQRSFISKGPTTYIVLRVIYGANNVFRFPFNGVVRSIIAKLRK